MIVANNFSLTLDTTGPASPTVTIEANATYATQQLVNLAIGCADGVTTGYQMKIWGSVDPANDANVQATEGASIWMSYATAKQVKLASGDGSKTINMKLRDDVYNESGSVSDTIIMDTTIPVVTITGPDVPKISKISGKDACSFSFSSDSIFTEYKVKYVASSGAAHTTGTQIPTAGGSSNMSGNTGNYAAATPISCIVKGADLETASSGDGAKIIKVFVRDQAGNWSA